MPSKSVRQPNIHGDCNYPLINQLDEILRGPGLNACLIAASLRPEIKIAVKEFAWMQGGYSSVAYRWYAILCWLENQLKMGCLIDREMREMLIGLAAVIKMKNLKVR